MIGLIDAKSGNIGSVENALEYLNIKYSVITKKIQNTTINIYKKMN